MSRSRSTGRLFAVAAAALASGCLHPYGKVSEFQSPKIPGSRFQTVSVIAGESDHNTIQIAARVRDTLSASKAINVVNRTGRWVDEAGALKEICPDSTARPATTDSSRAAIASDSTGILASMAPVDGVVIVWWNRISLRDCRTMVVAYDATGAAQIGVDELTRNLLHYLKGEGRH